jgi:hypothetical protein
MVVWRDDTILAPMLKSSQVQENLIFPLEVRWQGDPTAAEIFILFEKNILHPSGKDWPG